MGPPPVPEIPGAGTKHGEVVVRMPEQRRAVDDALAGYLANYEAAWKVGPPWLEDAYAGRRRTPP